MRETAGGAGTVFNCARRSGQLWSIGEGGHFVNKNNTNSMFHFDTAPGAVGCPHDRNQRPIRIPLSVCLESGGARTL